jgi:hypothetical protein
MIDSILNYIPPVFVMLRVGFFWIPLPVILFWPFLLILLVFAWVILAFVPLGGIPTVERIQLPLRALNILGSLRGLDIDIQDGKKHNFAVKVW